MPPTSLDSPTDVGLRVTDQQWEYFKQRIGHLYVTEGRTAENVRAIMKAEHAFDATTRMFKGRFNAWGMASKNIKSLEYEAMNMVYKDTFDRNGVEVMFSALKGPDKRLLRIADVRKELNRPATKRKSELNRNKVLERGVDSIFRRLGIEVIWPGPDFQPEPDADARVSMESPSTSLDSDSDQDVLTGEQLAVVNPNFLHSGTLPLHTCRTDAPPAESEKEADLWAIFAELMPTEYDEGLGNDLPPSILPQQTEAMRDTRTWAWHLFETCIKTDEKRADDAAGKHRKDACNMFNRMLRTSNPHILSSLIHIACVFYGLGGVDNYRWILEDCWELISKDLSTYQTYAIPYCYALACETGNHANISKFGMQLLNVTEHTSYHSQTMSSNFLVFQQFKAHHLLEHMQNPTGARDILVRCIRESPRCLEENHSVNVGCLNLLARAYEHLGQIGAAIEAYSDAARRSEEVFGRRHPFRMSLVRNIAMLQAKLGMTVEVEENLRQVFWCRNEVLGPGHGYTYSSAQELQKFLIYLGRHDDAAEEEARREALYHDDKHWRALSEKDAETIRRQRRNTGLYWEKREGLFKYEFVMPKEAYMRVRLQSLL